MIWWMKIILVTHTRLYKFTSWCERWLMELDQGMLYKASDYQISVVFAQATCSITDRVFLFRMQHLCLSWQVWSTRRHKARHPDSSALIPCSFRWEFERLNFELIQTNNMMCPNAYSTCTVRIDRGILLHCLLYPPDESKGDYSSFICQSVNLERSKDLGFHMCWTPNPFLSAHLENLINVSWSESWLSSIS